VKCLAKTPERRYSTVRELAEELERFLTGVPVRARPVGRLERGWRKPFVAGLLAVTPVLLVLAAIATIQSREAKKAAEARVIIDREKQAALDANDQLQEQLYDNYIAVAERELTLNQDVGLASSLLEKCPARVRDWEWDYLMRLRDGGRPPLAEHEAGLWMAVFSPNGESIATARGSIGDTVSNRIRHQPMHRKGGRCGFSSVDGLRNKVSWSGRCWTETEDGVPAPGSAQMALSSLRRKYSAGEANWVRHRAAPGTIGDHPCLPGIAEPHTQVARRKKRTLPVATSRSRVPLVAFCPAGQVAHSFLNR